MLLNNAESRQGHVKLEYTLLAFNNLLGTIQTASVMDNWRIGYNGGVTLEL